MSGHKGMIPAIASLLYPLKLLNGGLNLSLASQSRRLLMRLVGNLQGRDLSIRHSRPYVELLFGAQDE
jgi:hypothetical protein